MGLEQLRALAKTLGSRIEELLAKADTDEGLTEAEFGELREARGKLDATNDQIDVLEGAMAARENARSVGPNAPGARVRATQRITDVRDREDRLRADPLGGFRSEGEFYNAVRLACSPGGRPDERLLFDRIEGAPTNYHQEAVGADGGFLVPPQIRQTIWEVAMNDEGLLALTDSEPTMSNQVDMDVDEDTPWSTSGITAKWRAEASQMTATKHSVDPRSVRLHELYAFVTATNELLADAPRLENRLTVKAGRKIRWKIDDALIYGTGAGQPLGFFNSGALVTVTKEGSQAADTVVAGNVAKMYSRMLADGIPRAVWLVNPDVFPQLFTMTLGDNSIYALPQAGFKEAPSGFLLGRPVRPSQHCKTLGDKGDIMFVDLGGYFAAVRGQIEAAQSIHLYFDYNLTAFRWTFRLGGQPYLSAPVSAANGSSTYSHFVCLEART